MAPDEQYINALSSILGSEALCKVIAQENFSFVFDVMHASTGNYAERPFERALNPAPGRVVNEVPSENFGEGYSEQNLTYAADLIGHLDPMISAHTPGLGAPSDGDRDRNMVAGKSFRFTRRFCRHNC